MSGNELAPNSNNTPSAEEDYQTALAEAQAAGVPSAVITEIVNFHDGVTPQSSSDHSSPPPSGSMGSK